MKEFAPLFLPLNIGFRLCNNQIDNKLMEDDEQIMFDEMPDMFGKMFVENQNPSKSESVLSQKTYCSLYEELCDKCFPERYMQPYDAEKYRLPLGCTQRYCRARMTKTFRMS